MSPTPSLEDLGSKQSVFGSRFVGFMRAVVTTGVAATAAGGAALGFAHLESRFPLIRRVTIPMPGRSDSRPLRILQISDLHMFTGQDFIAKFLEKVAREEQFDFVISTGDNLGDSHGVPLLLDALEPLLEYPGAFVLGSNDYYLPQRKPWTSYLRAGHSAEATDRVTEAKALPWYEMVQSLVASGWIDMSNRADSVVVDAEGGPVKLSMIGVDDPHIHRDRFPKPDEGWDDEDTWRLALTHAPYRRVLDQATDLDSDLILAGHTHGGQIRVPVLGALVNNTDIEEQYSRGIYLWTHQGKESWMNISAGLGTSRFAQIRLFCRPEVSIITLQPTA